MALGWITGLIIFGVMAAVAVLAGINYYKAYDEAEYGGTKEKSKMYSKRGVSLTLVALLLLAAFICVPFSFHTVDTGEIAVVKQLGRAKYERTAGTYFDFWMTKTYQKYDSKVRTIEINTAAYSSDAQTMTISMDLQYQILSDKVTDIANQYGNIEALESRIMAIATERAKSTIGSNTAMHIIANRDAMSPAVEDAVREAVGEKYFVNIVSVVVTNIDFSDAFEVAVEEKMVAEQNQLKAEYENQAKVAKAEADAQAKLIAAEAESEANKLLEKSLTDKILQEMYIDKWDGKLPQVVAGDDASLMISPDGVTTE
jgi:regulator of protease activity HflC (stomatin/prohibitin superfamily)